MDIAWGHWLFIDTHQHRGTVRSTLRRDKRYFVCFLIIDGRLGEIEGFSTVVSL